MFLTSSSKPIDENLKTIVDEIEEKNSSLSVLAARKFRYSCYQTPIEVSIKEARQFNVLEEFILRTGIEFETPITSDELASILGLDSIFVKSTITTLQSLQVLAVTSKITITPQGRLFYEQGSVPKPPYPKKIYAIDDPLEEKFVFQYEPPQSLNDELKDLPDLANFITDAYTINDIGVLSIEELQTIIRDCNLDFHIPEEGKIVNSFHVISATQKIWKGISIFVIFDGSDDKLSIQARNEHQILSSTSQKLESLQLEGKIALKLLCQLSDDVKEDE